MASMSFAETITDPNENTAANESKKLKESKEGQPNDINSSINVNDPASAF